MTSDLQTSDGLAPSTGAGECQDESLREGIELMFFAYRDFTGDPDAVLAVRGLGRAHHRAIHFIKRRPGITVAGLLDILQVTKQSLNRVLRKLISDDLVESREGTEDRRHRNLYLTTAGDGLESELSSLQRERVERAYRSAGPEATAGFMRVLEEMIDDAYRDQVMSIVGRSPR
ncbi:MAG: MarR family winged helix-turn-helix transcriptional regulator [Pseudomonadota bacterium]